MAEENQENQLNVNETIAARMALSSLLGISHGGDRDIYQAFGYPKTLGYRDYVASYQRHDIAKAIIKRPAQATWAGDLHINEPDKDKETPLQKEFDNLSKRLGLKAKFARLDRLTSLGHYGVLLFGFSDCTKQEDFAKPVAGNNLKLNYVKPIGEGSIQVDKFENRPSSPRYGLPKTYSVTLKNVTTTTGGTSTLKVHYTRLIHVAWDLMEDETEGTPVLESVFNRLMDLEKLVGGSAEMFWRGARPGYQGVVDEDYSIGDPEIEALKDKVAKYENGLERMFVQQGVKLEALAPQVQDPSNHVSVQIQMISAVTGIPQRILTGSEQGELASGQDDNAWKTLISDRRTEQVEPTIVRPFIDKCIEYGILPKPETKFYSVEWSDLFAPSEKDRAEAGKTRAVALSEYAKNPLAAEIMPPSLFAQFFLGFSKDQVKLVEQMKETALQEESEFIKRMQGTIQQPSQQPNQPNQPNNQPSANTE